MQVVSNMIANSIHAMPDGGVLSISVRGPDEPHGETVLEIRDTGVGIAPENLAKIFEPFFTTRGTVGTGIGLWVAQQFIEGHGGRIEVESSTDPLRHGTAMRIHLPRRTAAAALVQ